MAEQFRLAAAAARLRQPSRYAQIGIVCALLCNGLIIGLDKAGVHYLVSTIAATIIVTIIGYLLHCDYTFRMRRSASGLARFFGATALSSLITIGLMAILCDYMSLSASTAIPIATIILFGWNYLMARWAIVRGRPPRSLAS